MQSRSGDPSSIPNSIQNLQDLNETNHNQPSSHSINRDDEERQYQ